MPRGYPFDGPYQILRWCRSLQWKLEMYDFHPTLEKAMQCAERALVQDSAVAIVQIELDPPEVHWRSQGWVPLCIDELIQKGADMAFRSANWDRKFDHANAQPLEATS